MAVDIILDDQDKEWITLAATAVNTTASEFIMDAPGRHEGIPGPRRALVHDHADGLTLNYNRDYPGGLTLNDARVRLEVHLHLGSPPALPAAGVIGEMYAVSCISVAAKFSESNSSQLLPEAGHDIDRGLGAARELGHAVDKALALARERPLYADADLSLWICVGSGPTGKARWQRIALAETIDGSI